MWKCYTEYGFVSVLNQADAVPTYHNNGKCVFQVNVRIFNSTWVFEHVTVGYSEITE